MDTIKRIDNLIYHLQGTCISFDEACEDLNIDSNSLSIEELSELDNWVFQCDNCGWWYDRGEMAYSDNYVGNICTYCESDLEE